MGQRNKPRPYPNNITTTTTNDIAYIEQPTKMKYKFVLGKFWKNEKICELLAYPGELCSPGQNPYPLYLLSIFSLVSLVSL